MSVKEDRLHDRAVSRTSRDGSANWARGRFGGLAESKRHAEQLLFMVNPHPAIIKEGMA